jgi:hypothetical protein
MALLSVSVDVSAMPDANDQHDQLIISNRLNDPVVAHAYAVEIVFALELDRAEGPRFGGKSANALSNPVSLRLREFLELSEG